MESDGIENVDLEVTLPRMKILDLLKNFEDRLMDISSGRVAEIYGEIIEQRQKEIAAKQDFTITEHSIVLCGHFKEK